MNHTEKVIEVTGKECVEDSSHERGFFKCKGSEGFKSKVGLCMHESWCKKLKQHNDTNKQATNTYLILQILEMKLV